MGPGHQRSPEDKLMKTMIMVGLAVVGIGVVAVHGGGLACAVDEALQQKGSTYMEWNKHKYQLQPVDVIEKDKKTHVLSGTLVHVNGKKDDAIAYRITKSGGVVKGIEVQINNGMWLPLSPELTAALGDYRKTGNVDQDKQGAIHQALYKAGKDSESSWAKTAELIVAFIAIRHC
jgi:hypothetical protein